MLSIVSLLNMPNTSSPMNREAANLYKESIDKYLIKVNEYIKEYASK